MSKRKVTEVSPATVRAWGRENIDLVPEAGRKCLGDTARGRVHPAVAEAFAEHNPGQVMAEKVRDESTVTLDIPQTDKRGRNYSVKREVTIAQARELAGEVAGKRGALSATALSAAAQAYADAGLLVKK